VRIMTIGIKVFPDIEKFSTWLRIPSIPLGGYKPIELLNVSYGQQLVYHELGHILYGIFA